MGILTLLPEIDYNSIANDPNVVGNFNPEDLSLDESLYASPALLNYVEPYAFGTETKTLFYTEVNTNLKVGDRVFIINGNYDSADLIKQNKYKKGSDGYRVLYVDRCQIVLDIDYTGELPTKGGNGSGEQYADYIKVHYIRSYDEFLNANKQLTTRGGYMGGKFDYYQNNIAFIDDDYLPIKNGWVRTSGVTASPGFYVREPAYDTQFLNGTKGEQWVNITGTLLTGSSSLASAASNPSAKFRQYCNEKLFIAGKSFSYDGTDFNSGFVYAYDSASGGWIPDVKEKSTFSAAIITRGNFRKGKFRGSFSSGVYGSKEEIIDWTGEGKWYGGTLYNANWREGIMRSNILFEQSHFAGLDKFGMPYQKANTYNNGGYGYNFIFDSTFHMASIYGSVIRNAKFGTNPYIPVVEDYLLKKPSSYDHYLYGGLYQYCEFRNAYTSGSAIKNSWLSNTMVENAKLINTQSKNVVLKSSSLITDLSIKILAYDEWTASERKSGTFSAGVDFKVFKLYIQEADFLRLRTGDAFYIKGISINNDDRLLNLFDRKFYLGSWTEYDDHFHDGSTQLSIGSLKIQPGTFYKRGIQVGAFLTTAEENEWIYSSVSTGNGHITDTITENPNPFYSIDIFYSLSDIYGKGVENLNFNYSTQSVSSIDYLRPDPIANKIDISNAYILDSNVESGIVDDCEWNDGFVIGSNNDLLISSFTNSSTRTEYNISLDYDNKKLSVDFPSIPSEIEIVDRNSAQYKSDIKNDDILFLGPVDYYINGKVLEVEIVDGGSGYIANNDVIPFYSPTSSSTSGYGLVISNDVTGGVITQVSITSPGIDYKIDEVLEISLSGQGVDNSGTNALIKISSVASTQSARITDAYKVDYYSGTSMDLLPVYGSQSLSGLTESGLFTTENASNRWSYLNRLKIVNSRINSGFFRRANISSSQIEYDAYNLKNIDLIDIQNAKQLLLSDMIFSDTGNKMGPATYHNSSILGGSDEWIDGIITDSILYGLDFPRGTIRSSAWMGGTFSGGIFYLSNSYDATPTSEYPLYSDDRIFSHYKSGKTYDYTIGKSIANNRNTWRTGTFRGGEFYISDWEDGVFSDGLFYKSKWYGGTASGGNFGSEQVGTEETRFYNGTITFATVDNATFFSDDPSGTGVDTTILWKDGIFNSGIFGSKTQDSANLYRGDKSSMIGYFDDNLQYDQNLIYPYIPVQISDPDYATDREIDSIVLHITTTGISYPIGYDENSFIKDLRIFIQTPDTLTDVLIKDAGKGSGRYLTDTAFTTEPGYLEIQSGNPPYTGTFSFDGLGGTMTIDLNKSLMDSIFSDRKVKSDGIAGEWKIFFANDNAYDIGLGAKGRIEIRQTIKTYTDTISNRSIWENGTFNSGQFLNYAIWRDGTFNGGKFLSTYGSDTISIDDVDPGKYTWQGGSFNGGDFGNSNKSTNSTWYNGEFNNGNFLGKIWNNGIFRYGTFQGSGMTATGGWSFSNIDSISNAISFDSDFVDGGDFYGLWKDGIVSTRNDIIASSQSNIGIPSGANANLTGILWLDGTFDNDQATITDSVWRSGEFRAGSFISSSFNPYIRGSFDGRSVWKGGRFIEGDFYYSDWTGGEFISGTAIGMLFRGGISRYMNAYNVVWEDGIWKNGNWYGSEFDYLGTITNPFIKAILDKSSSRSGINDIHLWNLFENASLIPDIVDELMSSQIKTYLSTTADNIEDIQYPPVIW